jgi:HTH DNA binding domain
LQKITIGIPRDPKIIPGIERFADIDYLWMVHSLRVDEKGVAGIWRMQPRIHASIPKIDGIKKMELLSQDSNGSILFYAESEFRLGLGRLFENVKGGNPYRAFELTPESVKISFLGSKKEVKSFVAQLERTQVTYKVLSAGNATFSRESVFQGLTLPQRRALATAHSNGYFEVPRRMTTESLAKLMGIDKSTLSEHLRRAERRIVDDLLS